MQRLDAAYLPCLAALGVGTPEPCRDEAAESWRMRALRGVATAVGLARELGLASHHHLTPRCCRPEAESAPRSNIWSRHKAHDALRNSRQTSARRHASPPNGRFSRDGPWMRRDGDTVASITGRIGAGEEPRLGSAERRGTCRTTPEPGAEGPSSGLGGSLRRWVSFWLGRYSSINTYTGRRRVRREQMSIHQVLRRLRLSMGLVPVT